MMLDKKILQKITKHNKAKLAVTDLDGILLGKIISAEKFQAVQETGLGFVMSSLAGICTTVATMLVQVCVTLVGIQAFLMRRR